MAVGLKAGGWQETWELGVRAMLWDAGRCDLQLLLCLVAPEKQGEHGENTARLFPIPISSPDSTRELLGPEHLGNLILQFRLRSSVYSPPQVHGEAG